MTIGRDHTLYAQWTPAPHTHDYKADVTPPSCTEGGYTTYTCTLCGHSYRDTYTPALGHSLGLLHLAQTHQILMALYTLQNIQSTTQPTYFFSRLSQATAIEECTSASG